MLEQTFADFVCYCRLLREQEGNPNVWFGSRANNYYLESIKAVAKFVGAKEENVVFADNATSGKKLNARIK
jgi:selenocysteine lyase/cysteine desulfurase